MLSLSKHGGWASTLHTSTGLSVTALFSFVILSIAKDLFVNMQIGE